MHIDPGGPAGKEYEIPAARALDQTGADAPKDSAVAPGSNAGGGPPAGGADPRRFGVGIEPRRRASDRDAQPAGIARDRPASAADRPRWSQVADGDGGGSGPLLWLLPAIAIAVLAAAGGLALALRRSAPRPT